MNLKLDQMVQLQVHIHPIEPHVLNTDSKSTSLKPSDKGERHYNKQWEQKYSWLVYDTESGSAVCKLCQMFMKNKLKVLQKTGGVFITVPFKSFKKALGKDVKLQKHEHSSAHTISVEMESLRRQAMKKPIHAQIIQHSVDSEKEWNRKGLKILLRGLYFLVKEEIAHTTKYESLIESILDKTNGEFKAWRHALVSSKETACELLECLGEVLRGELKETLKNKKFSVLADESTSLRNEMELSIMFRVMQHKVPVEKFLAIVKIADEKAKTIANAIGKELTALNLNYKDIIAFGFDGASNMAGNVGGVRKKLSEKANKNKKVMRYFHILKDIYKLLLLS
ncbi:hypothetical protein PYW08_012463 [Mythimna loreyi]|uniref:Uncharacterized protein n=1 Tax=Mythimna loreyi TaxID=667449 RepID=A0ACC2Q313_9NEOP|nr:hypothetical protein PYW08_012463 [Mythimna loreyi]